MRKPRTDDLLASHPGEPYPYSGPGRAEEKDLQGSIPDGVITVAKMATGLTPIQIVTSLPALPDAAYPQGTVVFLTTDNKLYRSTGTAWTVAVPTVDLTGTITTAQIGDAQVTTIKIGDLQVSTAKLIDGSVTTAKIGNQAVTSTQMADGTITQVKMSAGLFVPVIVAVLPTLPTANYPQGATVVLTTDNKLYRSTGTAWVVSVPATDLTGQVTTAQITNLAVDASKLAAAAVDLTKFAAGLRPVEIVAVLPGAGTQGRTVFLTTDNKLYRDTGAAWVATVPTTDLTGTITSAQIAAGAVGVAAFAAGLRPVEVLAVLPGAGTQGRTVFLTTDNKLYRDTGAAWVSVVPTTDLTGTISTAQIAAGAVTNAKLSTLSVELNNLTATMLNTLSFADARNRLMNAGFEDGTTYWQQAAGMSVVNNSANAKSGNKYMEITSAVTVDVNLNTNPDGTGAARYFEIPPGAVIKYGGWMMVVSGSGNALLNAITADKDLANRTGHSVNTSAGVWTFVSGTFTPSATDKYQGFKVTCQVTSGTVVVRFDDLFCYIMMPGTDIVANTITAAQIAAGTITANEIAALTIVAGNIAAGAITTAKISAGAVTANEIAAATITATQIAAATITGAKIAANTITAGNIVAGTITATEIAADTITAGQIAAGAITSSELAAGAVIAGKIAAGIITATEIAAATITGAKIAANTITAGNIVAGTITATEIAADTITAGQIAAGAITASELAANAVTAGKIAAGTITATEMAARSIGVRELFVGSFDNLVLNPGFEQSSSSILPWNVNGAGGGTWSVVSTNVRSGVGAGQFNPSGQSGIAQLRANGTLGAPGNFAATDGDQFYFEAWVRKVGTGTCNTVNILLHFRDNAGTSLASFRSTAVAPTQVYSKHSITGTAPATAVCVEFYYEVNNGGNAELVNWDDAYARRMVVGSIIVDGTITATKIAANTITAAQIAAGTITATEIGADVITAGNIAAGAVGASELAAGAVVAGKIAAGTIVANDIAAATITGAKIAATTITASNLVAGTITANEIAAGTITAAKMAVTQLSAIAADLGTITAGLIQDANSKYIIDLANALLTITDNQGSPVIRGKFGKVGAGTADYGLQIFDASGATIADFTGAKRILAVPVQPSSDSGTAITVDLSTGLTQQVRLTGTATVTLSNPTNGGRYRIWFQQDTTGTRPFPTIKGPNGEVVMYTNDTPPTLTATPGAYDLFEFEYRTSPNTRFTCMTLQANVLLPTPQIQGAITGTGVAVAATAHNISMPATVAAGDLLLVLIDISASTIATPPTGWTQLATVGHGGGSGGFYAFAIAALGTEGGTTVNFVTGANAQAAAQCYRITRWFGTVATGAHASAATGGGASTNPDDPADTPGTTDRFLWIAACGTAGSPAVSAYPTNYTNGTQQTSGGAASTCNSARRTLYAASDDPSAFTISVANTWGGITVSIRPPA